VRGRIGQNNNTTRELKALVAFALLMIPVIAGATSKGVRIAQK